MTDAGDALAVARVIARTGAHEEARALYEQLSRWAPNRAPVWAGLAEELSAIPADATGGAAIAAALRRARELDPGEAGYRAELALRTKPSSPEAEAHDDEKYIVSSQTILARRVGTRPATAQRTRQDEAPGNPSAEIVTSTADGADPRRPTSRTASCTGCARSSCTPTAASRS